LATPKGRGNEEAPEEAAFGSRSGSLCGLEGLVERYTGGKVDSSTAECERDLRTPVAGWREEEEGFITVTIGS